MHVVLLEVISRQQETSGRVGMRLTYPSLRTEGSRPRLGSETDTDPSQGARVTGPQQLASEGLSRGGILRTTPPAETLE